MANKHPTLVNLFTDIADAIRERGGTNSQIVADTFPDNIRNIPKTIVQSSKTVSPSESEQIVTPDNGYDALGQVVVNAINGKVVKIGSYTPSAQTKQITITHNLGVMPDFLLCYQDWGAIATEAGQSVTTGAGNNQLLGYVNGAGFFVWCAATGYFYIRKYDYTKSYSTLSGAFPSATTPNKMSTCVTNVTTTKATFGDNASDVNSGFAAGKTYSWLVGKFN